MSSLPWLQFNSSQKLKLRMQDTGRVVDEVDKVEDRREVQTVLCVCQGTARAWMSRSAFNVVHQGNCTLPLPIQGSKARSMPLRW